MAPHFPLKARLGFLQPVLAVQPIPYSGICLHEAPREPEPPSHRQSQVPLTQLHDCARLLQSVRSCPPIKAKRSPPSPVFHSTHNHNTNFQALCSALLNTLYIFSILSTSCRYEQASVSSPPSFERDRRHRSAGVATTSRTLQLTTRSSHSTTQTPV
jgi:hypothetical protein